MRVSLFHVLALSVPLVVLGAVTSAYPSLIEGFLPGSWCGDAGNSLRAEQQEAEALDQRYGVVMRRIAAKERVTAELLAGRLTLSEAAAWFRHINDEPSRVQHPALNGLPEGTRLRREVLWRAERQLTDERDSRRAQSMRARLKALWAEASSATAESVDSD
jgi:hypothetical protein